MYKKHPFNRHLDFSRKLFSDEEILIFTKLTVFSHKFNTNKLTDKDN